MDDYDDIPRLGEILSGFLGSWALSLAGGEIMVVNKVVNLAEYRAALREGAHVRPAGNCIADESQASAHGREADHLRLFHFSSSTSSQTENPLASDRAASMIQTAVWP